MEESCGLTNIIDESSSEEELNTEEEEEMRALERELEFKLDTKEMATYAKTLTNDYDASKSSSQAPKGKEIQGNLDEIEKYKKKIEIKNVWQLCQKTPK